MMLIQRWAILVVIFVSIIFGFWMGRMVEADAQHNNIQIHETGSGELVLLRP